MNNEILFLLKIMIILLCCLTIFVMGYIFTLTKCKSKKTMLDEYSINVNTVIDQSTFQLLDTIIGDCFAEYTVLNINYKQIEFINAELEEQVIRDVTYKVISRLSTTLLTKLGLIYQSEHLAQIISERVYLHTLGYVLEYNKLK